MAGLIERRSVLPDDEIRPGPAAPSPERPLEPRGTSRRRLRMSVVVLVVGVLVTGLLTAAAEWRYVVNEQRLSGLQTKLTGDALGVAPIELERRLGPAASSAALARDPASAFKQAITSSMMPKGPFAVAGLASVAQGRTRVLALVGKVIPHFHSGAAAASFDRAAGRPGQLFTSWVVLRSDQRFGYDYAVPTRKGVLVAFAAQQLPKTHVVTTAASNPDANLDVAIYWGAKPSRGTLILANTSAPPLAGGVSRAEVPFGNHVLTLVASPRASLAGVWAQDYPWGIAVVGALITVAMALMTERLVRRRWYAEGLALENRRMFQEQAGVAATLQHSLLPQRLARREGIEVAVRYLPATTGTEVGGDWYDLIELPDGRLMFSVGDVAGHGLEAASLMSMLRNAIRAFAFDAGDPAIVLTKTSDMLAALGDERFATAICGMIDSRSGEVELANAGHPAPVLIGRGRSRLVTTALGPPLGVSPRPYGSTALRLEHNATLLAFTDGLVERKGESVSDGMERVREAAGSDLGPGPLLDRLVAAVLPSGAEDDVAILALRWTP